MLFKYNRKTRKQTINKLNKSYKVSKGPKISKGGSNYLTDYQNKALIEMKENNKVIMVLPSGFGEISIIHKYLLYKKINIGESITDGYSVVLVTNNKTDLSKVMDILSDFSPIIEHYEGLVGDGYVPFEKIPGKFTIYVTTLKELPLNITTTCNLFLFIGDLRTSRNISNEKYNIVSEITIVFVHNHPKENILKLFDCDYKDIVVYDSSSKQKHMKINLEHGGPQSVVSAHSRVNVLSLIEDEQYINVDYQDNWANTL